jgi:lipopolysaccharide/colanic/teichoic acid biosynthesis glycosyltransferase
MKHQVSYSSKHPVYDVIKRFTDIVIALVLLIISLPLSLAVVIVLVVIFKRNPFYIQKRGLTIEHYVCSVIKFRTMKEINSYVEYADDIIMKKSSTIIICPFCRWLRKTGIDELPQLLNVIKGEMSLVGPRPLSFNDLKVIKKNKLDIYKRRSKLRSKPGISGYWQIYGNRREGLENLIEFDEIYEKKKTVRMDLFLMTMTVPVMIFARHSDALISNQ